MMRPLGDKILVKPEARQKYDVLMVIMDEADNMGTVVAVGPGKRNKAGVLEMPVKVGDRVRFGTMGSEEYLKYTQYIEKDERYLIMSWQDVCFVEEPVTTL